MPTGTVTGVLEASWAKHWQTETAAAEAFAKTPISEWRAGGRVSKEWPNKENAEWWAANGPAMLQSFVDWWEANNDWHVWISPDGEPAVELDVSGHIAGLPVKAFVDLVAYDQDGVLSVVDFKTGSSTPTSGMQLGLYATLIEQLHGVRPQRGYFYSARKGMMIPMQDMDRWTEPVFERLFEDFNEAADAHIFLPNLGMTCGSCSVNTHCFVYSGSTEFDPLGKVK